VLVNSSSQNRVINNWNNLGKDVVNAPAMNELEIYNQNRVRSHGLIFNTTAPDAMDGVDDRNV
jgi:hypothetical protein